MPSLPRGVRNNNPGNLVKTNINWQGKKQVSSDPRFEQFVNLTFGIRAKLRDILNDINKGLNTIPKLITEFAPPHENNTNAYIAYVLQQTKLSNSDDLRKLNRQQLVDLSWSIIVYENGGIVKDYISKSDIEEAIDILGSVSNLKNLSLDLKKPIVTRIATSPFFLFPFTLFALFF